MVTCVHFTIYSAVVGLYVFRTENMVYAQGKSFLIIRQADASARGDITVGQHLTHGMAGIRDGIVVEIATNDDGVLAMTFDVFQHRLNLGGTLLIGLREFDDHLFRLGTHGVFLHFSMQHLPVLLAVLTVQVATLEMVVDDNERVVIHLQPPGHTAIGCGGIRNALALQDGVPRMNAQAVHTHGVMGDDAGVVVGEQFLLVLLKDIAAPRIHVFLHAHNVRLFVSEIFEDDLKAVLVLVVAAVGTDIIGHEFDSPVRDVLLHIDRHVYTDRYVREKEARGRNPQHAPLEDNPKDEESQIEQQKYGEGHADGR